MSPTPWMIPVSRGVTLANAPPPTALGSPVASLRCGVGKSRNHGGSSPQALAKAAAAVELAELRLRNLAPRAVAELEALVTGADSEQVRLQAANSLVDRSVGRATERIQVAAAITVVRPW